MTALITGASAGIGKEFAVEFAKDGIDLILVARREESMRSHAIELEKIYGVKAIVIAQDLSTPNSADILYDKVTQLDLKVDYLINNAGFGDNGEFVECKLPRQEEMINLNILTLTKLTHLFGKDMKENNQGSILNVASMAAFIPGPLMGVYFATKHYVLAFSEAIAEELRPYNVFVSALCPGPTESEFGSVSGFEKLVDAPPSKYPSSSEVAKFGYQKMKQKKVVFVHGLWNRVQIFSTRLTPRFIVRRSVHWQMK